MTAPDDDTLTRLAATIAARDVSDSPSGFKSVRRLDSSAESVSHHAAGIARSTSFDIAPRRMRVAMSGIDDR